MGDDSSRARRERRRAWPVRIYDLGKEPGDDLSATTTPEQRLAMVWPLTVEAYTLAGISVDPVPRGQMKVRIVHR